MKNLVKGLLLSGNIPYIKGHPGMAKSASMKSIADDAGWLYIDLRLSQKDETDISGLPLKDLSKSGVPMTTYALPQWFELARETAEAGRGVLIHFEELNRTTKSVRDACLEILNERTINNIKLPANVFMVASGNLGEEDGCDVDDIDAALVTRLVPLKWDMTMKQWIKDFAGKHVDADIIAFLNENAGEYHNPNSKMKQGAAEGVYPNPRTWTNLSKYIKFLRESNMSDDEIIAQMTKVGASFIGTASVSFIKYLQTLKELTEKDVLDNFSKFKTKVRPEKRTMYTPVLSIITNYTRAKFTSLTQKQIANLVDFSRCISKEDRAQLVIAVCKSASTNDIKNQKSAVYQLYSNNKDVADQVQKTLLSK